jgi:hypothetical protein
VRVAVTAPPKGRSKPGWRRSLSPAVQHGGRSPWGSHIDLADALKSGALLQVVGVVFGVGGLSGGSALLLGLGVLLGLAGFWSPDGGRADGGRRGATYARADAVDNFGMG